MMGRLVRLLMLLLVVAAPLAYAADVGPGDQVRLIERDQHIPALDSGEPPWVDRTSFCQITCRQADKAVWDQLSDHGPVLVELWIR
jgi:hypothetical protein